MEKPFVSVILPVRNEEKFIHGSLMAILTQTYPASRMEVLVVVGMSSDATRQIVSSICEKYPDRNIEIMDNPANIVPAAMNMGLKRAKGDVIIRVDGHCEINKDYIEHCVAYLSNGDVDCVGGSIQTIGSSPLGNTIAIAMSSKFGVGGTAFRTLTGVTKFVDTVPFPAFRRETVQHVGGFDETMLRNEDDEYNFRIRALGGKILLGGDLSSRYFCRNSLSGLWQQYFQYGLWKVRLAQKYPRQMKARHFVPLTFIFSLLISLILALIFKYGWILLALILGSYFIINLIFSITNSVKNRQIIPLLLPVCYLILHISYGLGFLAGLSRFAMGWNKGNKQVSK